MLRTSIRNKLIALLMITTILPFGSSIIVTYLFTKESLKEQAVQENRNLLYQGKVNLESYVEELNGLTLSLYRHTDFMNYTKSPNELNNYAEMGGVKSLLITLLYATENIERVYLSFGKKDGVISASKRSTIIFSSKLTEETEDYYALANKSPYNMYIEPIHRQRPVDPFVKLEKPIKVIALHRAVKDIPSEDLLAFITLEFTPDEVNEISQNLYSADEEEFYIFSPQGVPIYNSHEEKIDHVDENRWVQDLLNDPNGSGAMELREDSFSGVMIFNKLSESAGGWILVKRIPYTTLYKSVFQVAQINILFGVIGLSLVILATLFVSFKITSPIRVLLQQMNEVEKGNMQVHFSSLGTDEIGVLGDRFKSMIGKVNTLINREYRLELENKTNQLKVLQSQINPHFLYNSLQSIGTLALKNNVPQIYSLITRLSIIMRYGMNMDEDFVPLAKEINYIEAYLLLQKERFDNQLEYKIMVEEEAAGIMIPKMIIQPIIENYFKHGFDKREGMGKIYLHCKLEGSFLMIQARDNGIGIPEARLQEIRNHLENKSRNITRERTNIGLKNISDRLQLYYSGRAALELQNYEGGVVVTIKLPIHLEGARDEGNHY